MYAECIVTVTEAFELNLNASLLEANTNGKGRA